MLSFLVGKAVWVRNVRVDLKWAAGEVCAKTGPEVNVDGLLWKCHAELLSQSGSNYQTPDAHIPTEMDGGLPWLADHSYHRIFTVIPKLVQNCNAWPFLTEI